MPIEFIILLFSAIFVLLLSISLVWFIRKKRSAQVNGKLDIISNNKTIWQKNAVSISDIESLILKDNSGCELALIRPDMKQLAEKKYREICVRGTSAMGQVVQGAMPILAQTQTLSQIAKVAPNGLFTATGSVQDLMKYSNGTVASFVRKGGHFGAHSGFAEVAVKTANPAAVVGGAMQTMALISGQYYMHQISEQLKSVDKKLDKLIGYHHDEKIGILKNVNRNLFALTVKTNVDAADIISCQRIAEKCGEVYYEYQTRLEVVNVEAKDRWFNKSKELKELGKSIDESEMNFSIQMCHQASMLYEKCKLAEIAIRMKIGSGQERFISEQVETLCKFNDEAFHKNVHRHIEKHYAQILEKVNKITESNKVPLFSGNISEEEENIQHRKKMISDIIRDDVNAETLVADLVSSLCKPKETLVLLGEEPDTGHVFVLVEDE